MGSRQCSWECRAPGDNYSLHVTLDALSRIDFIPQSEVLMDRKVPALHNASLHILAFVPSVISFLPFRILCSGYGSLRPNPSKT